MLSPRNQKINKNKKKRHKFSFVRFLFFLVVVSFVAVFIYALFFSPFLKIISISIAGNDYVEKNLILDKINHEISGKYLEFIEKNNLFLVRDDKIKKEIQNEFKIIKEIKIKKKFPSELVIDIVERKPQIIFCSAESCFILDENGEAYDYWDQENKKDDLLRLYDGSLKKINLGEIILEKSYLDYILGIKRELIERFKIETDDNFYVANLISKDIKIKTKEGWEAYFNENIKLEKEMEMLKVVLEDEVGLSQCADLEYIDLRIDNKIYYKFREGTLSQIAKTQAENPQNSTEKEADTKDKNKKNKD